jgi:hypothetical protein
MLLSNSTCTATLWDLTQVHGAFLQLPPCPWPRFCRAFLAPRPGAGAALHGASADATLIGDVCVALLRVGEGGAGAGYDPRQIAQPLAAKGLGAVEEPEDLRLLDWSERVVGALYKLNSVVNH